MNRVLIANRGEIAVRIVHAARELGWSSVAVHPADDAAGLHVRTADSAVCLPGTGPAAYLDVQAIVDAAVATGAEYLHPGYGFLSEVPEFAVACDEAGLTLIGPGAETLRLLGDKARAREFAVSSGVAVTPGLDQTTSLPEARAFLADHGPTMLKAIAGGGGRGMAACRTDADLVQAYDSCSREARASFGNGDLYVEKLVSPARHIEVQIVGDGTGAVTHLWERDCTIQRRHQKLVEVAPSPALAPDIRSAILQAAVSLASDLRYRGLGTFEFLVSGPDFYFMEANPRLQVEHTVTEEITGVDLVRTQLRIAAGATLTDLDLTAPPRAEGTAIQVRINAEVLDDAGRPIPAAGTVTAFTPPSGPGIRVDAGAYAGLTVSPRYDSLLAKVIARGPDFAAAAARSATAITGLGVAGVQTNRAPRCRSSRSPCSTSTIGRAVSTSPDSWRCGPGCPHC